MPGSSALIEKHTVGNALVLHARERISAEARSVALTVHRDPENDIVILDLQNELPFDIWDAVAGALRRRRRGIRLVVCGAHPQTGTLAGQWLSERLGCPVVTPFGRMIPAAAGTLFVHAEDGGGWVRYRRGRAPVWQSKRYPVPAWDGAAIGYLPVSSTGAVEPLPGGVWIRQSRDEKVTAEHWQRLTATVPCQPRAMAVVLGCPGTDPLSLNDIARFWRGLAPEGREHARFVQYGPVALPDGASLGQVLADLLTTPVAVFTGVPAGKPDSPEMFTVLTDGGRGWQVFVQELGYRPRETPASVAPAPRVLKHRAPEMLGEPIGPRTYRYAPDAVVEVVQAGLWLRAGEAPGYADRVRALAVDPQSVELIIDDADPSMVDRYRQLAGDLAARLDRATRERTTMRLSSVAVRTGRKAPEAAGGATHSYSSADLLGDLGHPRPSDAAEHTAVVPRPEVVAPPVEPTVWTMSREARLAPTGPAFLPAPVSAQTSAGEAQAPLPAGSLDEDRTWLRREFSAEFDTAASAVSRVLAGNPALRSGLDAREDAVAVRLYLSSHGDGLDTALRSGEPGGQVAFARCVAAGLAPLPSHRGIAYAAAEVTAAGLRELAGRKVLTDRAFTNALSERPANLPGNVEVLIWSTSARRTRLLEPEGEDGVPARVLFPPGTAFKVLEVLDPVGGEPGRLLLRELAADEPGHRERVPFDDLALAALYRHVERRASSGPLVRVPSSAVGRFARVPGGS